MYIVKRSKSNPIISPVHGISWQSEATFNPTPVYKGKDLYVLYRAYGSNNRVGAGDISTIGIAREVKGQFIERQQFIAPVEEWERYGCEDPRTTFFEGKYVTFYTALGGQPFNAGNIKTAVAISKDLSRVDERHLVTPFNSKGMTLFPKRVNGKITAILTVHTDEPPSKIAIVQCDKLEDLWDEKFWQAWHADLPKHVINPVRFERDHVEVGATPIPTSLGWLVIYSYIQNYFSGGEPTFGIEAMILDKDNPLMIVAKSRGPIMAAEEVYENYGIAPRIVFPTGAILDKRGKLDIYYGAADTVCAKASLVLRHLLDHLVDVNNVNAIKRAKCNPIIAPNPDHAFETRATFNAATLDVGSDTHILYRAMSNDNTSTIGYARTTNGEKIVERLPEPVYVPRADFELKKGDQNGNSGCEDPRLTKISDRVYMLYTAYDGVVPPRIALTSISLKDFKAKRFNWSKPILTSMDGVDDKDGCLLPEKVNGKYVLLHRIGGEICADYFDDLSFKRRANRCFEVMGPRRGSWDSRRIGIAGVPIKTSKGWLCVYHGISNTTSYRLGVALFDLKDPTKLISRLADPILEPKEDYETAGEVPKVIFSCGASVRKDKLFIYYGGADKVIGVASLSMKRLLEALSPTLLNDV